jgi:hypothetical protein
MLDEALWGHEGSTSPTGRTEEFQFGTDKETMPELAPAVPETPRTTDPVRRGRLVDEPTMEEGMILGTEYATPGSHRTSESTVVIRNTKRDIVTTSERKVITHDPITIKYPYLDDAITQRTKAPLDSFRKELFSVTSIDQDLGRVLFAEFTDNKLWKLMAGDPISTAYDTLSTRFEATTLPKLQYQTIFVRQ